MTAIIQYTKSFLIETDQKTMPPTWKSPESNGQVENRVSNNNDHMQSDDASPDRRLSLLICILLATMVWFVFGQTVHFDFINYDDPAYVCNNPAIIKGFNWHGIIWTFSHVHIGTWFPLTDISHQLCWQFFGANAGGHHLVNVLLHAATAVFLFLALQKLTSVPWPSAFVAAVFAIHPLRVESVAWVVERKDVLSGLFFMMTLWAWARYVQNQSMPQRGGSDVNNPGQFPPYTWWTRDYFLALIFFALGLLSKSMLVTLPFVLLLLDYWPLDRITKDARTSLRSLPRARLDLVLEKTPFFILSGIIMVVTLLTQKNAVALAKKSTLFDRFGNAMLAYVDYLRHMLWPVNLTVVYPHPDASPAIATVGWAVLILCLITAAAIAGRHKLPWIMVGWLWYLGMLAPVIDIMQAGLNARADRYTYLPQIGLYILTTWSLVKFCATWRCRRFLLGSAAVIVLVGLLFSSHRQTTYWKNSVTLWTHSLACTSKNSFAENNLGSALNNQGDWGEAALHFARALQFDPDNLSAHVNLGVALINQKEPDAAISQFEQALQLNPNSIDAHYNLGVALAGKNNFASAIAQFEKALNFCPDYPEAHYNLGLALARQQRWAEAIPHFESALGFKMDEADAKYIVGVKLAAQNKWTEAIELYQMALQLKPDFAEAHNNIGIALVHVGKTAEAAQHFDRAIALATEQGNSTLVESIPTRINSHQTNAP